MQEILALPIGSNKRKALFTKLRNLGNFVVSSISDQIVPVKKPTSEHSPLDRKNYLPCKFCKGFYKRKYLRIHLKKCLVRNGAEYSGNTQSDGQSLLSRFIYTSLVRKEVFPIMRADEISLVAKCDTLICSVGERYLKSHRDKQFRVVASRKMRQLATLLIEIKKKIQVRNLFDALCPENFETIIICTKLIAKYDEVREIYAAPSLAANIGTLLKDAIDVAHLSCLKSKNTSKIEQLKSLKDLVVSEWRYEVSTVANHNLEQNRWNKPSLVPLAEDLITLRKFLINEGNRCISTLNADADNAMCFKKLQEILFVQLILLNRRRVGELQRMTLENYLKNINKELSSEYVSCLTESEKCLTSSFKRIVIRGKRGRGVPVLFTEKMVSDINILINLRNKFVTTPNIYLFASTKSGNSITGSNIIYRYVRLAGVKNPSAISSTKLRKHLATISQVVNLSEQDMDQLATFMGHTTNIHKNFYRLPNDVFQTAKISKLLLLSEKGKLLNYKGKRLHEIDINLCASEDELGDESEEENVLEIASTSEKHAVTPNPVSVDFIY